MYIQTCMVGRRATIPCKQTLRPVEISTYTKLFQAARSAILRAQMANLFNQNQEAPTSGSGHHGLLLLVKSSSQRHIHVMLQWHHIQVMLLDHYIQVMLLDHCILAYTTLCSIGCSYNVISRSSSETFLSTSCFQTYISRSCSYTTMSKCSALTGCPRQTLWLTVKGFDQR